MRKYKKRLNKKFHKLFDDALVHLRNKNRDQHNEFHSYRMLENLDRLIAAENLDEGLDLDAVILAVIWHDTFKAKHGLVKSQLYFWFIQFYEGRGAEKLFRKAAKKYKLQKEFVDKVSYSIRVHPAFEFMLPDWFRKRYFDISDMESMVLRDLDLLEATVSAPMIEEFRRVWIPFCKKHLGFIDIWVNFYNSRFSKASKENFYFEWSQGRYKKLGKKFNKLHLDIVKELETLKRSKGEVFKAF